jgi:hypothetical protein
VTGLVFGPRQMNDTFLRQEDALNGEAAMPHAMNFDGGVSRIPLEMEMACTASRLPEVSGQPFRIWRSISCSNSGRGKCPAENGSYPKRPFWYAARPIEFDRAGRCSHARTTTQACTDVLPALTNIWPWRRAFSVVKRRRAPYDLRRGHAIRHGFPTPRPKLLGFRSLPA